MFWCDQYKVRSMCRVQGESGRHLLFRELRKDYLEEGISELSLEI